MAKKSKKSGLTARAADRHALYEVSVQVVEADVDFVQRVYRTIRGERACRLREDFCGTACLAREWVRRRRAHEAWGIDLESEVLDWARAQRMPVLGPAAERLHLVRGDVMRARVPPVDITVAFNFSYFIFKTRPRLRRYFEKARAGLASNGILVLDLFGGSDSMGELEESRTISGQYGSDGRRIPSFTYHWQHARFNPVTHEIQCHIHFSFRDRSRINRAYTYDWRVWSIPELRELLAEAGFCDSRVYAHGWDEDGEADGIYRERKWFQNEDSWLAYIVAMK